MGSTDKIWYDDIFVIWKRPLEFFPARGQTPAEHMNAIVRLILYTTIGLFAYNRNTSTIFIGLAAIIATTIAYRGRGGLAGLSNMNVGPRKCRASTKDNPFGNTLVNEYGKDPLPDPPCAYDDVKEDMEKNFNEGLFRNVEDWSNRENSQRQFFTVPTGGNPPDTKAFAEFLYGGTRNCKTDSKQCL